MLEKKRPVRLLPSMAGMLEGANHAISPNPITFRSVRSQSLSKQVNFPPQAFACLRGFLGATGAFTNPEARCVLFEEEERAGDNEEDKRKMKDAAADRKSTRKNSRH